tara:strand:- start:51 stop:338 length:288 start_codon:yes stop_codon:yes gene_type:complete
MCRFYKVGAPGSCDHDRAEPPARKESANFCGHFRHKLGAYERRQTTSKEDAERQLDALFGDAGGGDTGNGTPVPGEPADPDRAAMKSRLDALFDD